MATHHKNTNQHVNFFNLFLFLFNFLIIYFCFCFCLIQNLNLPTSSIASSQSDSSLMQHTIQSKKQSKDEVDIPLEKKRSQSLGDFNDTPEMSEDEQTTLLSIEPEVKEVKRRTRTTKAPKPKATHKRISRRAVVTTEESDN